MAKPWIDLYRRLQAARLIEGAEMHGDKRVIDSLTHDSRAVRPGGLFVAIRGETADGHQFIDKAVQNESIAVVCEVMPEEASRRFPGVAFALVSDSRAALAVLAAEFFDDPSLELELTAVTGTNGKSTTAHLFWSVLTATRGTSGLLGTIEYRFGTSAEPSVHTTPDALELHRMLRRMRLYGCAACALEVSSHALAQQRTRSIDFDAAIFTNLTLDHTDYHGTFEDYRSTKKLLFDDLKSDAVAVYNADDVSGRYMVSSTAARTLSYGEGSGADVRLCILDSDLCGLRLRLDGQSRRFRLVGRFNAWNLAAAYAAARGLGYEANATLDALEVVPAPKGRLEQFVFGDGTRVIVDYAHTPDALEKVLSTIRAATPEKRALWCLFGCGGERDRQKRPLMGRVAERLSDRVIVTRDNSRTEPQSRIEADIRRGMRHPERAEWIADRRRAIRLAARKAAPGDVVLLAGKGHESFQTIGTCRVPFDDRREACRAFQHRGIPT